MLRSLKHILKISEGLDVVELGGNVGGADGRLALSLILAKAFLALAQPLTFWVLAATANYFTWPRNPADEKEAYGDVRG